MSSDAKPLPAWLTIDQVARHINMSEKSVRRYIAAGKLTARRFGARAIRVDRESLLRLGQPIGGRHS